VVSSINALSKPVDTTYKINTAGQQSLPLSLVQVDNCQLPYTYLHSFSKNGVAIAAPTWITFDETTKTYSYSSVNVADIGIYVISYTASTSQLSFSNSWQLTAQHECTDTIFTDRTLNAMAVAIAKPAAI